MAMAEVLAEQEVTTSNLAQLFKRAFFKTSVNEDDSLIVDADGVRVLVRPDHDRKIIQFMSFYGVKESARLDLMHAFTNRLNETVILVRFYVLKIHPDALVADYYLGFEEGIPAYQIVAALRLFARIVPDAIRACDENHLLT